MLEVRLSSGQVVAFDGRVLEVFVYGAPSSRLHLAQLDAVEAAENADGTRTVELEEGAVTVVFAEEEAPVCARLLAAIAQAQTALARPVAR